MNYQYSNSLNGNQRNTRTGNPDPKCRMVEHIMAQYNSSENYVRNVMNETKVGATRQPAIINMIRNII